MISMNEPSGGGSPNAWCGSCRCTITAVFFTLKGWRCPICKNPVNVPPSNPPPTQLGLV